jgi:ElaA protein
VTPIQFARFDDLDLATLYDILRLRVDVFVVEQACAYAELDGRDTDPATWHCWADDDGRVVGYLRAVAEPDRATRIGRVVTAPDRRGEGIAASLLRHALTRCPRPAVADVQEHLVGWYERFGFESCGPSFDLDGIPHVPMRRS